MSSSQVYECPKCHNRLLYSNKMLHDLKCTEERPVKYSLQNPTASFSFESYNNNDFSSYQSPRYSVGGNMSNRLSVINDDGTTTEIKKETNMKGQEELLEITYDPQGNIIGRKKADGGRSSVKFGFRDMLEYKAEEPTNYVIYEGSNVYVETVPTEIVYETSTPIYSQDYGYEITNFEPFEHDYGNRGYSLMDNNIDNATYVNANDTNINNQNYEGNDFGNYSNSFSDFNNYNNYDNYNYNYNYNDQNMNMNNQGFNFQNNQLNGNQQYAQVTRLNK